MAPTGVEAGTGAAVVVAAWEAEEVLELVWSEVEPLDADELVLAARRLKRIVEVVAVGAQKYIELESVSSSNWYTPQAGESASKQYSVLRSTAVDEAIALEAVRGMQVVATTQFLGSQQPRAW